MQKQDDVRLANGVATLLQFVRCVSFVRQRHEAHGRRRRSGPTPIGVLPLVLPVDEAVPRRLVVSQSSVSDNSRKRLKVVIAQILRCSVERLN